MRSGTGKQFPLYDVTRSKVIKQIDSSTLNIMACAGQIGWFTRKGRSFPCIQPAPQQSRTSPALYSSTQITRTDSALNAEGRMDGTRAYGFNRYGQLDDQIVGNRIDQAMSKVEAWPEVHDTRAVVISAGRVFGAIFRTIPRQINSFA
jgi:hypothetical protein